MRIPIGIKQDLNHIFVSADHHLGHENVIKLYDRPFVNWLDMDITLIDNWNKIVGPQDWVIYLADFTLHGGKMAQKYFALLNGDIRVLSYEWHHDRNWLKTDLPLISKSGLEVQLWPPMVVLEIPELGEMGYPLAITLCHYPMAVWDRKHFGAWHLHGHSHGKCQHVADEDYGNVALDVGVDCRDFRPVSLAEVRRLVKINER